MTLRHFRPTPPTMVRSIFRHREERFQGGREPGLELAQHGNRSSNAKVSAARIRLDSRKIYRAFNGIICDDISEFESYMASHAVGLSASLLVSAGGVFRPAMPDRWSKAKSPATASPADREIRASRQSQDRESARPRNTANIARCWSFANHGRPLQKADHPAASTNSIGVRVRVRYWARGPLQPGLWRPSKGCTCTP
jgi:hypothetical protein